jgi:hypothetical protein
VSHVTRIPRRLFVAAATVMLLLLAVARVGAAKGDDPVAAQASSGAQATCVFTNPAYSGKCTQTTAIAAGSSATQACQSVLACLNDAQCLQTFCNATTVRGGWKLESAK